ncbi:beta-ketoacyl-ACP synthase III [Cellulomonas fengjieae]|uniref:Beta-ketoacyl-[acyl-carrier-protein] synthase III n=1 Tax=Cellulomonas fengjieae TaxID=2819978 RepID=A0ABS3SE72_9CELL|nr:beta-ketoacyl-ACP synthase III [Cellulomonas fengjieae]MBO3084053.1 ketoacyl-ACP synthase III [Cellulomonas fengjieae]QVI64689.1 ketoacyl-ACP synthase III [Cellulomonas fengjieae]
MTRPTLTQATGPAHTRILGIGGVRGERVVPNDELVAAIDSSDEWIRQRTGIVTRRRAEAGTDVLDLAEGAARAALENAGLTGADIDVVILSTVTYFHQTPAGAAIVAERIGAIPAAAYDISAACAGYCYGIGQADALVRAGSARNVLVIGAEKMSEFVDPTDRSISFLLGDGAGAVVVGPSDTPGIGPTIWGSDGSQAQAIRQTHSWLATRDEGLGWPTLRQEGPSVYKWAVWQMAPVAQKAMDAAGVTADQIEAFIPHQANMRIIDQMVKTLKLPDTVVVGRDIVDTGNTSAASIPLATERLLREGQVPSGAVALQIGFGAGLVYAAQVVVLP